MAKTSFHLYSRKRKELKIFNCLLNSVKICLSKCMWKSMICTKHIFSGAAQKLRGNQDTLHTMPTGNQILVGEFLFSTKIISWKISEMDLK